MKIAQLIDLLEGLQAKHGTEVEMGVIRREGFVPVATIDYDVKDNTAWFVTE